VESRSTAAFVFDATPATVDIWVILAAVVGNVVDPCAVGGADAAVPLVFFSFCSFCSSFSSSSAATAAAPRSNEKSPNVSRFVLPLLVASMADGTETDDFFRGGGGGNPEGLLCVIVVVDVVGAADTTKSSSSEEEVSESEEDENCVVCVLWWWWWPVKPPLFAIVEWYVARRCVVFCALVGSSILWVKFSTGN